VSEATLRPMREDLSLSRGSVAGGTPTWTIYDPARHRYIRLGWLDFEILTRWHLRTPAAILDSIKNETTLRPVEQDVARFAAFASEAGLMKPVSTHDTARLAAAGGGPRSPAMWLIHNYLFIRLRLVDPDRFLATLLPVVRPLFTPFGVAFLLLLGTLGLFLISREWETYTHSLVEQYTVEGLLSMAIALSVAKVFHELGHGFAAKLYGCRVPSMGVALLVLWPVLWTDTTDAWRLVDRRQRLVVDVAGMAAEILVAALASIAWAVLPDGSARNAMFVLSSTTWILTLLVNVMPLLRFDGYYILSDLLDVPNLQERAFAHARWWLRELLFRPDLPPPETHSPRLARILLVYALACWVYRLFVFSGIALLVYHMTFKALGIVLAAIEVWFFLARPVVREIAGWPQLLRGTRPNRHIVATVAVLLAGLVLLFVPWRGQVEAPGLLRAARQVTLLAAEPGRLISMISQDAPVAEGDVLFLLDSPTVSRAIVVARAQLEAAQAGLTSSAFDPDRRRSQQAFHARVAEATAALSKAEAKAASLSIRAPFSGTVKDMPPDLRVGDDVRRLERLGVLVTSGTPLVEAFVAEPDLDRVAPGAPAHLILLDGRTVPLVVAEVAHASSRVLEAPELASINEGPIAVRRAPSGSLLPERAVYRVILNVVDPEMPASSRVAGRVTIEAAPRSAASMIYRRAVALLVRESSM